MIRSLSLSLILTLLLATPAGAAPLDKSKTRARVMSCVLNSPARGYAIFEGMMNAHSEGEQLAMRFELYVRRKGARTAFVRVPNVLGSWRRSNPGIVNFRFRERLEGLSARVDYRARVTFRWLNRSELVSQTVRRTGICRSG